MYRLLFLLLLLPAVSRANGKDNDRIYEFLNQVRDKWAVREDDDNLVFLSDVSNFGFFQPNEFATYQASNNKSPEKYPFSKKDSIQVFAAIKQYKDFKFEAGKLKNTELIRSEWVDSIFKTHHLDAWNYLRKKTKVKQGFIVLSIPVFLDDDRAVFYYSNHCGGLCGSGTLSLFKKVNGVWTEVRMLFEWVS